MAEDDAQQDERTGGWEVMHRNLATGALLAEAELYAAGWRKLTVDHGRPLTPDATALLERLVDQVDDVVRLAGATRPGTLTCRTASMTWAFPPCERTARQLVIVARLVADGLEPGGWVVTADDYP